MQNDQLDPWAEGKRGMIRGAVWAAVVIGAAWLIAGQAGIGL